MLHALEQASGEKWRPYSFGPAKISQVPLDLAASPTRLTGFDAQRHGLASFLLFQENDRPPLLLAAKPDGSVIQVPGDGSLRLGNAGPGAVFFDSGASPTILVAQENFARKLQRRGEHTWQVVDQYNASEPSAHVVGAALIDLDGKADREVVLIDTGIRKLRILRRDADLYRPWKEVELGSFPYEAVRVADLNGDGRDDLLLFGRGRFAVLYAGQSAPALNELATFETKIKKATFADVVAGDLNGDGRPDLALIDTQSHNVEILALDGENRPVHAFQFKIFEEKSFNEAHEGGTEPREAVISDVTGDGRPDLVLLAHDRVLVYPQDDGK